MPSISSSSRNRGSGGPFSNEMSTIEKSAASRARYERTCDLPSGSAAPLGSIGPVNAGFGWLKRESQHSIRYLRSARLVLAGSPYLADLASPYARRIEIIPSCVEPATQPMHAHKDVEAVTIGWIGST